jgi:hypothetical protein
MATLTSAQFRLGVRGPWVRAGALGGMIWTVCVALFWPGQDAEGRSLAGIQLLLAPLALAPLALALIRPDERDPLWRLALWTQLPAALLLVFAFAMPAGLLAALLAAPWLAFTGLLALSGLRCLGGGRFRAPEELAIAAGLIYAAVGGAWTAASRLGRGFLGFEEPLVLLTGAHFHYAGLLLPILTGLAARRLRGALARVACVGVIVAVPLVAVGITLAERGLPLPDLMAALLLSAVGLLVAFLQLRLAIRAPSPLPFLLFVLSGLSLAAAMALAAVYAVSHYASVTGLWNGDAWISIPQMIRYHAPVNVFGFALPGLLGWLSSD